MSTLETNAIGKYSGNNVSVDDSLNLKSYTTTQRDALTSVAGDMIYNSTTAKVEHYNGSAWASGLAAVQIQYVIVGGGGAPGAVYGAGTMASGGGGAGGYVSSVIGENTGGGLSSHQVMYIAPSTNYPVSIGAGGTAVSSGNDQGCGFIGTASYFNNIVAMGGGAGNSYVNFFTTHGRTAKGGSGGGQGTYLNVTGANTTGGEGLTGQGYAGGNAQGSFANNQSNAAGGGGGAGAVGGNAGSNTAGAGGAGVATSISGSSVTYAGGGGGGGTTSANGGAGGGGNGAENANATAGTVNTGGGGGGVCTYYSTARYGGNGGSGVIYLLYPDTYTIQNTGMTLTETDKGDGFKYAKITAGTGTVRFV
nr:hypothetical protein [uncultured Mediterranean phage uvMED]